MTKIICFLFNHKYTKWVALEADPIIIYQATMNCCVRCGEEGEISTSDQSTD